MTEQEPHDEIPAEPPAPQPLMWRYPETDGVPGGGQTVFLLTTGGAPTIGLWGSDAFIAWFPIPKRDLSKEPQPYYKGWAGPDIYECLRKSS